MRLPAHGLHDAERELHDAFLDLTSIKFVEGTFSIDGFIDLPARRLKLGRYKARLVIQHVTEFEIIDSARVDQIDVDALFPHDGGITLRGKMPVEIKLTAQDPIVTATIEGRPFATRGFRRWRAPRSPR